MDLHSFDLSLTTAILHFALSCPHSSVDDLNFLENALMLRFFKAKHKLSSPIVDYSSVFEYIKFVVSDICRTEFYFDSLVFTELGFI
jgi:hypothetical protein